MTVVDSGLSLKLRKVVIEVSVTGAVTLTPNR
jgi:hypothetical protein